jgi:hypothetical protein
MNRSSKPTGRGGAIGHERMGQQYPPPSRASNLSYEMREGFERYTGHKPPRLLRRAMKWVAGLAAGVEKRLKKEPRSQPLRRNWHDDMPDH